MMYAKIFVTYIILLNVCYLKILFLNIKTNESSIVIIAMDIGTLVTLVEMKINLKFYKTRFKLLLYRIRELDIARKQERKTAVWKMTLIQEVKSSYIRFG